MNNKLAKRIEMVEDEVADEQLEAHLSEHAQLDRDRAMLIVGGFKTTSKIASAITSEIMRALEIFQQEGSYRVFGYDRFVDFLEDCSYSPMSKSQYYERKALLDKEGDPIFDLLSDLGMSVRKRRLLGKGNVEIQGETAILHTDDGQEITVDINDRTQLLEMLTIVADANAEKSVKLTVQKDKIEKHDEKVREIYAELDTVKASKIAEVAGNPHMIARVELGIAFRKLTEAAANLSAIEKTQFRDMSLQDIAGWRTELAAAYQADLPTAAKTEGPKALKGLSIADALDDFLENDAELAEAL